MTVSRLAWPVLRLTVVVLAICLVNHSVSARVEACSNCKSDTECKWEQGVSGWRACTVAGGTCTTDGVQCFAADPD
jgi:hypothetical protein